MFTVRVNIASIRASHVAIRCLSGVNNVHNYSRQRIVDKLDDVSCRALNSSIRSHSALFASDRLRQLQSGCNRAYSTEESRKADTFGELGSRGFEKVKLDEDEEAEEKFVENEARVFREHRLTPGGYAKLIKKHLGTRDYDAALKVLDMVKDNRDRPTVYMYNLLLRAFAVSGNFKKSRSLYVTMKKRGMKCNAATYTSILNACANYHHSPTALEYVEGLRAEFIEKNIVLNDTHYNAMIKVYGRHNKLKEAFKVADEMRDKKLATSDITFNSLLIGAISDREHGLQYALAVWHIMKRHRIKPTIKTYNLMLRAIRDTQLGDLKVNDMILESDPPLPIVLIEGRRPDLLSTPPSVSSLITLTKQEPEEGDKDQMKNITDGQSGEIYEDRATKISQSQSEKVDEDHATKIAQSQSEEFDEDHLKKIVQSKSEGFENEAKKVAQSQLEDADEVGKTKVAENQLVFESLPATVTNSDDDSEDKTLSIAQKRMLKYPLEKIHRQNRLILFGGMTGILERMARDRVEPDTKTITILMELSPRSDAAEKSIIQIARSKGINLDIDFYNMLMKKRTLRKDYAGAKEILDDIQRCGLCPDIITWGILAMGCQNSEDARTLIDGMQMTGHRLNPVIAGTLINIACKKIRFGFVLEIMEIMAKHRITPTWETYKALDGFQTEMLQMIASKKFYRTVSHPAFKTGFSKFNLRYSSWQLEMGRKMDEKKPKNT